MSKPPRFFITPAQVHGPRIMVSGDDLSHIRSVLRKQPGDTLILLDGQGREYTVRIAAMERSGIITEIVSEARRERRYPLVTLGQGLPKSEKMDWIVQKATELGVSSIVPLVTERTIVKIRDEEKRVSRWQKIAREAAMQSNRVDIPEISKIRTFHDFIMTLDPGPMTLLLFPWEEATMPIKDVLREKSGVKNIIVLIGPEGGFSAKEAEAAGGKGFHLVSLGPNILRTETAAVAMLSMILYETSTR
jgi:16S rRNA (uracil1498-N3)-methyltransferase